MTVLPVFPSHDLADVSTDWRVCHKHAPGVSWRDVHPDGQVTLSAAVVLLFLHLLGEPEGETGLFRQGFLYWTTEEPDLFSSSLIRRDVEESK